MVVVFKISGRITSFLYFFYVSVHVKFFCNGRRNLFGCIEDLSKNLLTDILTFCN